MKRDTNHGQFSLNVVINGRTLLEVTQGDETYVVAEPGQHYSVQLVLPRDQMGFGAVLNVDGINCFGSKQLGFVLAARPDAPILPRGINQREDDPSENELSGPMVGNRIEGLFVFAENIGSETGQAGTIQVDYYTNAHLPTLSIGASRGGGSDLHTELSCGTASVRLNSLKYEPGELICSLTLRYASFDWLRANGLIG